MQYKEAAQICANVFKEKETLYGFFFNQYDLQKVVTRLKNKLYLAQSSLSFDVGEPIQTIYADIYNYALMGTFFTKGDHWSLDSERQNLAQLFEVRNKAYNNAWVKMSMKDILDSIFVKSDRIEYLMHQTHGGELLDSFRDICNYAIFNIIKSNQSQPFEFEKRVIYGKETKVLALNMSPEKSGGVLSMYANAINKCKATLSAFLPQYSQSDIDILIARVIDRNQCDLPILAIDNNGDFCSVYDKDSLKIIYEK
jgi:Nucleotide modification associated domain 1